MSKFCEMCLIPFKKDLGQRNSAKYCSFCFTEGELLYKGSDSEEFKNLCYKNMLKKGMNKWKAKFFTFFIPFAPYWRDKN